MANDQSLIREARPIAEGWARAAGWDVTLVDAQRAADAGRAIYDAVYAEWLTKPEATRPKLMAYGLSLGSYSIQSAFYDAADLGRDLGARLAALEAIRSGHFDPGR